MKTISLGLVRQILILMLMMALAVPTVLASAGTLVITADTILTEDHHGNILINASKVTLDCAGHTVSGPSAAGFNGGIEIAGGMSGVTVRRCKVTGFEVNGLFGGGADGRYEDNFFYGNGNHGLHLDSATGNAIVGNMSRANGAIGIVLTQANKNWIVKNVVEDNHNWAGIALLDGSHDNLILDNTSRRNALGFVLDGSVENEVRFNEASSNDAHGIVLIRSANSNLIDSNTVVNNQIGISFSEGSESNEIRNNEVNRNSVTGFDIFQSNSNRFSENTANKNGLYGFLVYGGASFNTIIGNTGRANGLFDGYDEGSGTGNTWKKNHFGKTSGF